MHGGATAQRFYNKFPVYRERGHGAPDVTEDIAEAWRRTIDLNPVPVQRPFESMRGSSVNRGGFHTRTESLVN